MKRFLFFTSVIFVLITSTCLARPIAKETGPIPQGDPDPRVELPPNLAKTAVDTTYLLGGPGSWDGSFETPDGQPDWHGWTHEDASIELENHWHVSSFMADQIPGTEPGNHALYCGDETIAACDPPDMAGGYGNAWFEEVEWRHSVADPSQTVTVRLTGLLRYDTEQGYDYLQLFIHGGDEYESLASWDGLGTEALDYSAVLSPGDFTGPDGDEIRLAWRFTSDNSYSDEDCLSPSQGACQIDDLAVEVGGSVVTFDDFEPGNPVNWNPYEFPGPGDFSNLRNNLPSVHPCQSVNLSYQANFIDDGVVVPGTGGTPCIDWCYGPGGWIVNNDGGLMNFVEPEIHLINRVISPPLAWPAGLDGAEMAFDAYQHHMFNNSASGASADWLIRSTSSPDPADLANAPWVPPYGRWDSSSGIYQRISFNVGRLMVQGRQWVQIALGTMEWMEINGINGPNGTPAPYFDNVTFKVWDPQGPDIEVRKQHMFGDAFPENGALDPLNLAANWCRIDMMGNPLFLISRGDSLVAEITPMRQGAVVVDAPDLHWVMKCNPVFDSVRPQGPDSGGILRGATAGSTVLNSQGNPVEGKWAFDLPDTGFFFPGDRLRCYLTAEDDLDGDVRMAVWPPDTSGILDFSTSSPYSYRAEARALPSVQQTEPGVFSHPGILLVDDANSKHTTRQTWLTTLEDLGLQIDVDFEIMTIFGTTDASYLTSDNLAGYRSLIYSGGEWPGGGLTADGDEVTAWLDTGGKSALFAGDNLARYFPVISLKTRLGIDYQHFLIQEVNGDYWDLQITPQPGNGVLPDDATWQINSACPEIIWLNAVAAQGSGLKVASLDPLGSPTGIYAGVVTVDDPGLANRTAFLPFDLHAITGMEAATGGESKSWTPATYLVAYLLNWLGADGVTGVEDLPGIGQMSVTAYPNPFNPSTTIAFDLPRATEVSLDIYDLQGRLVRRLLDESPFTAGGHQEVWDGRDAAGRATSSGVYFFRFTAGAEKRVGKLTLLK